MSIKFGIIGHGFMGHTHEKMLTRLEGIQLTAIADIDPKQLEDVQSGIKRYTNPSELINDPDVQVVLIAANNNQHHKLVIEAARAGKDVLCEKPIAMSLADLDDMEKECQAHNVRFTVHHQRRFDPDFRTVKVVYDSGSLGNIYMVKTGLYGFNGNMHDWHIFKKEGGGMLYDWGVHLIDQMLWMIGGKLKTVYADVRNVINEEVDDYFKILLRFENGIMAEIELGTYYLADKEKWFERHWFMGGNKGSLSVDGFRPEGKICRTTRLLTNVGKERTISAAGPTRSFGPPPEGIIVTEDVAIAETKHEDYFKNYIASYHSKEDFLVKISETRRVLQVMNAARESAVTRQVISFE
ncbi:MAG: Gfo/Idh/MocA family oxidoreductase [Treponema sp.]|nr:Gfo/Idh/MocA family oxidoreductase [Treponema sp.]